MLFENMRTLNGEESFHNFYTFENDSKILTVKTCTCSVEKNVCPSHTHIATDRSSHDGYFNQNIDYKFSNISITSNGTLLTTDSNITVVPKAAPKNPEPVILDELKLSLSSLTSDEEPENTQKDKEEAFQRWLSDKNRQRKEERKKLELYHKNLFSEKEKKLEEERQSFAFWLKAKKEQQKIQQNLLHKQKAYEEQMVKEEKERRQKLVTAKYNLWLKRKEEESLKNKMKEQISKIETAKEKQKRMQESMEAYDIWLKNSKYKPKPVPSNRGLDNRVNETYPKVLNVPPAQNCYPGLKTSVSVSFINPVPWVPNIDKPATQ